MLNVGKMRFAQIVYSIRSDGWRSLLDELVFRGRTAIFVEKNLSEVVVRAEPLSSLRLELIEIDKQTLHRGAYRFAVAHRYLKALHYLESGCSGFAIARNNVIVGDMWCYTAKATEDPSRLHVDLQRFGFRDWRENEVYTFDIFVAPAERKQGVSAAFQNNATAVLASKGYVKAYGYYFADNVPAQWCTRVTNRWKELRAARVSRFFVFTRFVPLPEKGEAPGKQGYGLARRAGALKSKGA
jgi:GNAT superfamily N-acetyltransferase